MDVQSLLVLGLTVQPAQRLLEYILVFYIARVLPSHEISFVIHCIFPKRSNLKST